MRRALPIMAVMIGLIFFSSPAHAGAWVAEAGHGYFKGWMKWMLGTDYSNGDGARFDFGRYHELSWNVYTEIGVGGGVQLYLHAPLLQVFLLEDTRQDQLNAHVHPGDPSLGLTWQLLTAGSLVVSIQGGVTAPLATGESVQTVYSDKGNNRPIGELQVGTGRWQFPLVLAAGYGWTRFYGAGSVGYVFKTGGFDADIVWSLEGGGNFGRFAARFRLVGRHPIETGAAPRHDSPSGIGNGTQYVGLAAEGDVEIVEPWRVGLVLEGGLAGVRRQAHGPVISVAVSRTF